MQRDLKIYEKEKMFFFCSFAFVYENKKKEIYRTHNLILLFRMKDAKNK